MKVKNVAFVSVLLTGYVAMSFGILKIFWRQFGAHFYSPGIEHPPQAGLALDTALISLILFCGMCLVVFRLIVPALVCLIGTFFFEFTFLHDGHHSLVQYVFVIGAIVGQLTTLMTYLVGYSILGKSVSGIRYRIPPQDV